MVKYSETSCESTYDGNVICKFKWTIQDFMSIKEKCVNSPDFSACDCNDTEWYIAVYPTGDNQDSDCLGIYLYLKACKSRETNADFTLTLLNDDGSLSTHKKNTTYCFDIDSAVPAIGWGWGGFMKRSVLEDNAEHLLPNGGLTILCEITLKGGPINHSTKAFLENLGKMLSNQKYSDVTLLVNNKAIKVHKVLLASKSSVFAEMFDKQNNNSFVIADIDYDVMVEVLEFVYTGKISKLKEMAKKLLIAAKDYAVIDLKEQAEDFLCKQLTVENACETLVLFDTQSCNRSKHKVKKFISENLAAVMKTKGFIEMKEPHLIKMILKTVATIKDS